MIKKGILISIFLCAPMLAGINVQDLIDSGQIKQCLMGCNTLQLDHRELENLYGLENITGAANIEIIDLSYNNLKDLIGVSFKNFPNLKQLLLKHNQLTDIAELISIPGLDDLRELHLTYNNIKNLDLNIFSKFTMLYILDLGFNQITTLTPKHEGILQNLELLFLNNNNLAMLPDYAFIACPQLQALYLQDNMLSELRPTCFRKLSRMRLLYLQNNLISKLPTETFCDLSSLHLLYLRNNMLAELEKGWSNGLNNLQHLDLINNNLSCEKDYQQIKKLLDQYTRPITILDIGETEESLSWRLAKEYDCTYVILTKETPKDLLLNNKLTNVVVLEKTITAQDLKEIVACEHFDVVLAAGINQQDMIDQILMLGDNIFIDSNLYEIHKNILAKPTWGSPNIRFYPINSNFQEKTIYKPRIHKTIEWKKGINLWTFKNMNGVYPTKETIHQEIKRLAVFPHLDFMPWNMVIQGNNLELIDWDDNNAPVFMHNHEACIAQYESK